MVFIEELYFTSIFACLEHWAWCLILVEFCFFAVSNEYLSAFYVKEVIIMAVLFSLHRRPVSQGTEQV
jgi:hypothetical protein